MSEVDLDAYFRRIGYDGARAATLAVLRDLHRLHPAAIPFENLNSLSALPVLLDLPSIQRKLIGSRRGGYCFEHNNLFMAVLRALGFPVTPRAARVSYGVPPDVAMPRSHMALEVTAEGRTYLCDVGFGGLTQTGPLALDTADPQMTPHEEWRVVEADRQRMPEARVGGAWQRLYRYDLIEAFPVDFEVSNWYVSTSPDSIFLQRLMAARALPEVRYALANTSLSIYRTGAAPQKREIGSSGELISVLDEMFDIEVPDVARLEKCFVRWRDEEAA